MASVGTKQSRSVGIVAALAAGRSYDEVAESYNVSKRTIVRKMGEAAFRAEVHEARSRLLDEAIGSLASEAAATVKVLLGLRDGADTDATRLSACRVILDRLVSAQEYRDLLERITALEEKLRL